MTYLIIILTNDLQKLLDLSSKLRNLFSQWNQNWRKCSFSAPPKGHGTITILVEIMQASPKSVIKRSLQSYHKERPTLTQTGTKLMHKPVRHLLIVKHIMSVLNLKLN